MQRRFDEPPTPTPIRRDAAEQGWESKSRRLYMSDRGSLRDEHQPNVKAWSQEVHRQQYDQGLARSAETLFTTSRFEAEEKRTRAPHGPANEALKLPRAYKLPSDYLNLKPTAPRAKEEDYYDDDDEDDDEDSKPPQPRQQSYYASRFSQNRFESRAMARKRVRRLLTAEQTSVLYKLLEKTHFPSTQTREEVAKQLGISPRKVQVWFQNRRQVGKKMMMEAAQAKKKFVEDVAEAMVPSQPQTTKSSTLARPVYRDKLRIPIRRFFAPSHYGASSTKEEDDRTRAWREHAVLTAMELDEDQPTDPFGPAHATMAEARQRPSAPSSYVYGREMPSHPSLKITIPSRFMAPREGMLEPPLSSASSLHPQTAPIRGCQPVHLAPIRASGRKSPPLLPPLMQRNRSQTMGRLTLPPLPRFEQAIRKKSISPSTSPRPENATSGHTASERYSPYRLPKLDGRQSSASSAYFSGLHDRNEARAGSAVSRSSLQPPTSSRCRSASDACALKYPTSVFAPGSRSIRTVSTASALINDAPEAGSEWPNPDYPRRHRDSVSSSAGHSTASQRSATLSARSSYSTTNTAVSTMSAAKAHMDRTDLAEEQARSKNEAAQLRPPKLTLMEEKRIDSFSSRRSQASSTNNSPCASPVPAQPRTVSKLDVRDERYSDHTESGVGVHERLMNPTVQRRLRSVSDIKFTINLNDDKFEARSAADVHGRERRASPLGQVKARGQDHQYPPMDVRSMYD